MNTEQQYRWARRDELDKFSIAVEVADQAVLQTLVDRGYTAPQLTSYLADNWCICDCLIIDKHTPKQEIQVLWAWGKDYR